MWSGPRNLSTALMYAFGNRADTTISDEPYYGAYLHHSGAKHPMNEIIIESQSKDPDLISSALTGPVPKPFKIWYQKLITHHMLPKFSLDWVGKQKLSDIAGCYRSLQYQIMIYDIGPINTDFCYFSD